MCDKATLEGSISQPFLPLKNQLLQILHEHMIEGNNSQDPYIIKTKNDAFYWPS